MRLYYRTTADDAKRTVLEGFRDDAAAFPSTRERPGIVLTDQRDEDAAAASELVAVDIDESIAAQYEWVLARRTYREFTLPAVVLNEHAKCTLAPP